MKHFIITKVAVLSQPWYMDNRFLREKIFNEYCIPSIEVQTSKNFERLLLFDEALDPALYEKYIWIGTIILTGKNTGREDIMDYIEQVSLWEDYVLTTRFDSDDILAPEFVEKTQQYYKDWGDKQLLAWITGAEKDYHTGIDYLFEKEYSNPFITLKEFPGKIETVFCKPHWQMDKEFSTEYIKTKNPMRYRILHWVNRARKEVIPTLKRESNIIKPE